MNEKQATVSRRAFVRSAAGPVIVPGSALGLNGATAASDRITMAAVGLGPRGQFDLGHFLEQKDVRMVAVCDCFAERRAAAKQTVDRHYGNPDCASHRLHERILERRDIDAILTAGGDRWHAVMSVLAARAGKDVYCEKPVTLTIGEGRSLVGHTKKNRTVWQCGTQRRSNPTWRFVVDAVRKGRIGELRAVTTSFGDGPWRRTGVPAEEPAPDPEVFDYDRWLGQAPWAPYSKLRVQLWRVNFATGAGAIADMGAHYFEAVQWARGNMLDLPVEYEGAGVFLRKPGINNIPYFYTVRARYRDGMLLVMDPGPKGVRFDGDEGFLHILDDGTVNAAPKSLLEGLPDRQKLPPAKGHWNIMAPHIRDFLDAVRSRGTTVSNPEVAQATHTIIHCANLCLRLNRPLKWDAAAGRFAGDAEANGMISRPMREPWRI